MFTICHTNAFQTNEWISCNCDKTVASFLVIKFTHPEQFVHSKQSIKTIETCRNQWVYFGL